MTNTQRKINTAQNAANDSRKAPFERSLYEYTSALRVPRQHLPQHHGRKRPHPPGPPAAPRQPVRDRLRCDQP